MANVYIGYFEPCGELFLPKILKGVQDGPVVYSLDPSIPVPSLYVLLNTTQNAMEFLTQEPLTDVSMYEKPVVAEKHTVQKKSSKKTEPTVVVEIGFYDMKGDPTVIHATINGSRMFPLEHEFPVPAFFKVLSSEADKIKFLNSRNALRSGSVEAEIPSQRTSAPVKILPVVENQKPSKKTVVPQQDKPKPVMPARLPNGRFVPKNKTTTPKFDVH